MRSYYLPVVRQYTATPNGQHYMFSEIYIIIMTQQYTKSSEHKVIIALNVLSYIDYVTLCHAARLKKQVVKSDARQQKY